MDAAFLWDAFLPPPAACPRVFARFRRPGTWRAAYTGISWHPTWEKQLQYILEKKIKNCKYHYFDNFNGTTGDLQEVWRMDADTLLKLKLPSLKKQWEDRMKKFRNGNPPKDPRLSFTLGRRIIEKYGKRIK